jgi:hypothetical protein
MRQPVVWIFVALTFVPTMTFAQGRYLEGVALGPIARAAIEATSNGRTSFQVSSQTTQQTKQGQTQTANTQSWFKRHPVVTGLLIGAGVGAIVGAVGPAGAEYGSGIGAPFGALMFAPVGAAVGFVAGLTY